MLLFLWDKCEGVQLLGCMIVALKILNILNSLLLVQYYIQSKTEQTVQRFSIYQASPIVKMPCQSGTFVKINEP